MTLPDNNPDDAKGSHTKSFLEHLEDLRSTLLWCVGFMAAGMAVAVPVTPWVIKILKMPLSQAGVGDPDKFLRILRLTDVLSLSVKVIFWTGLLLSIPFILMAIGKFVFPALTKKERKTILISATVSVLMFAGGVALGYFMMLGITLKMIFGLNQWIGVSCEFIEIGDYMGFVLQLLICFGMAFELPLIVLVLGLLGIISSAQLRSKRRHAIVVLMIISAIITPTPDAFSMLVVAAPMVIMYEMSIWIIWSSEKKRSSQMPSDS